MLEIGAWPFKTILREKPLRSEIGYRGKDALRSRVRKAPPSVGRVRMYHQPSTVTQDLVKGIFLYQVPSVGTTPNPLKVREFFQLQLTLSTAPQLPQNPGRCWQKVQQRYTSWNELEGDPTL